MKTSKSKSETTSSAVLPKEQTDDEVIANPSADQKPEKVAQTDVTMEGKAP